uniref:RING-type E3 ubiquitin transferase n=1 Tax=Cynoglossus semilaevis TaxID=244447 RepID=A0A3P8VFM5_CYNSE
MEKIRDFSSDQSPWRKSEILSSASHQMQVIRPHCSNSDTCSPTPSCRICFQGAEQGALLNPCRCDGSVRYTHQHCLLKWISERGSWTCELCCYRFQVIAVNMKRPWQWQSISITLVEKVQIIAVFLGSLFLVSSVSWLLWSALSPQAVWQRRDVLFQICYGMYGFMDLVCVGLIVHEGAAVYNVFLRWRAVNLHWDVQSYDKTSDLEDLSTGRGDRVKQKQGLGVTQNFIGPCPVRHVRPSVFVCLFVCLCARQQTTGQGRARGSTRGRCAHVRAHRLQERSSRLFLFTFFPHFFRASSTVRVRSCAGNS